VLKSLIRLSLFITISLNITQYIIGCFSFDHPSAIILFIMGLTLLYMFMRPLLILISLPNEGPGYIFMSFILTAITVYVLTLFIPFFKIRSATISELMFFGYVLPSKQLSVAWSMVFSSLLIAVLMVFFNWICESRKR